LTESNPGLIPWPQQFHMTASNTARTRTATHVTCEPADAHLLAQAVKLLDGLGLGEVHVRLQSDGVAQQSPRPALGDDESYSLLIPAGPEPIVLEANTRWGALRGLTSLWMLGGQASSSDNSTPVSCQIVDSPRFAWRGLLLDVARHFVPIADLRRVVDGLARLKLNVLHLHLTDDQAFRFASQTLPELVSDDHYSQQALSELVAYASQQGVRVVPEFDVPGHVTCWVAAYPELGILPATPSERFGVHEACLDPTNEQVYAKLGELFSEVATVFPDDYVHIGGDEVHPKQWSESERVRGFIERHGLHDGRGLQNYFNERLCKILRELGKHPVGWDEVLHEAMPALVVQNWRGMSTRDRVLNKSLDCIVSAPYYLDLFYPAYMHYQHDPLAPQAHALAMEDAHQNERINAHVASGIEWTKQWRREAIDEVTGTGRVLGGEACLWSELVDHRSLDVRLWSRLPAVAERLWSAPEVDDVADFYTRLERVLEMAPFELVDRQRESLRSLGLDSEQAGIACLLEPVKWYARLLGEQALKARLAGSEMPQARPYNVSTPLNRIVDHIAPESLSARALQASDREMLLTHVNGWVLLESSDWPEDVQAAIDGLQNVGLLVSEYLRGERPLDALLTSLWTLYEPLGEYMLAVIPALDVCLRRDGAFVP